MMYTLRNSGFQIEPNPRKIKAVSARIVLVNDISNYVCHQLLEVNGQSQNFRIGQGPSNQQGQASS